MKTIYISGPMRGYVHSNCEAFDFSKQFLTEQGWDVIHSPADHDREMGIDLNDPNLTIQPDMMEALMRWDMMAVIDSDAVYMLQGWEKSLGARAEHAVAVWAGKQIIYEPVSA